MIRFRLVTPGARNKEEQGKTSADPTRAGIFVRLRHAWRWLVDRQPLTARGWLLALLAAGALWLYGLGALDLLLFVMGLSGLALLLIAALAVTVAMIVLRRRTPEVSLEPRLEAEVPLPTGFVLPSFTAWPLVHVSWSWLEPSGVETRRRQQGGMWGEEVVPHRRFSAPTVRRRLLVQDVFGLARLAWERASPGPVAALPSAGRLRNTRLVQSIASAEGLPHPSGLPEGDRMEIRRYVPGDPVRHLMWKVYARTRQLNVRVPERSVDRARRTVAYLMTGPGDEAAAAAARVALEEGALGGRWAFAADGTPEPAEALEEALAAIARSGSLAPGAAAGGLTAFLGRMREEGEIHCIVFAPGTQGPWLEEAVMAAGAAGASLAFVLGVDGVSRREPVPLWKRWLFEGEADAGVDSVGLAQVLLTLERAGCPSTVVDRLSGRAYGGERQRALGALA